MKYFIQVALATALATPALAADLLVTTSKHTPATKVMGQETPAQDSTETTWIGKDRMRTEDGDTVTIVRNDLKKMFIVHTKDKTYSALDLPFDMKKYVPAEMAPMIEAQFSMLSATLTPTTETKKIKDWNATKYVMNLSMGSMQISTSEIWTTKDVAVDRAAYADLQGSVLSMMPGGSSLLAEYKKLEGFPVLTERTNTMMGSDSKSKDEVTAVEQKEAPAGTYDVPKEFTEKPFDWMNDNPGAGMGPGGGRPRGAGRPGGMPPGDKPVERPKIPPAPAPK